MYATDERRSTGHMLPAPLHVMSVSLVSAVTPQHVVPARQVVVPEVPQSCEPAGTHTPRPHEVPALQT